MWNVDINVMQKVYMSGLWEPASPLVVGEFGPVTDEIPSDKTVIVQAHRVQDSPCLPEGFSMWRD